tara:strand:+ start:191935 stop:192639 length:705 start_codon:yes stop_codon:yes gene_type:complete
MPTKIFVLIPAAGVGARFGAGKPKQYLKVAEKTILEHVVECFAFSDFISGIHIGVSDSDPYYAQCELPNSIKRIVGGDSRQTTVINLLQSLQTTAKPDDWVLVHDAARPTLSHKDLMNLVNSLKSHAVGGILAKRVSSTIKFSEDRHSIAHTIDREDLWEALTPQMFRYALLSDSMHKCKIQKITVTDESQAVELAGYRPKIIEAQDPLIKLTRVCDLSIIEAIIKQKKEETCV